MGCISCDSSETEFTVAVIHDTGSTVSARFCQHCLSLTVDDAHIELLLDAAAKRKTDSRDFKERQRRLLTSKLRWEIIARDGACCSVCGCDGSESPLNVDHITPIASGGKTEPSNLRVLCRRCNQGKRDGLNVMEQTMT